ncbi:MAG: hypothetical protein JJT94_14670 [Bernardetiaceae bacterium]|nr:hypothetical protein [Bernardetiaceae bacterium]
MPIEIKELVMRVRIEEKSNNQEVKISAAQKEKIIQECTQRALKQLEKQIKRQNFR